MTISISPETQKLLDEQMKRHGYATPDEAVRVALENLGQEDGEDFDDLDADTQNAIAEGLAQAERGRGRSFEEVRDQLLAQFVRP